VLDSATMKAGSESTADARLDLRLLVEAAREGRKPVHVSISVIPRAASGATLTREFKTTLSEPVDDEQWRVLGEGAAYRLIGDLEPTRITRPALRAAQALQIPPRPARRGVRRVADAAPNNPLELRIEPRLGSVGREVVTVSSDR
jgi:hypothetical protein